MTVSKEFKGIFPYLVSPIDQTTGQVNEAVLADLVNHLIDQGVHGLSPLGSTGEITYLSLEQRAEIVRVVIEATAGRVPVVPGVAAYTIDDAIAQARRYEALGADGIVLMLQAFFPLPKSSVERYFQVVAGAISLPIVIYTNPRFLGVDVPPGVVAKLSEISNIRYVKDATPNTGRILTIMNAVAEQIAISQSGAGASSPKNRILANMEAVPRRLKVFGASAHIPLLIFQLGGVGWMAGPACLLPAECVQLYNLAQAGRWDEAWQIQRPLWRINEVFQKYSLAACVKAGLELQGFKVGAPILPQEPLGPQEVYEIRDVLRQVSGIHNEVSL